MNITGFGKRCEAHTTLALVDRPLTQFRCDRMIHGDDAWHMAALDDDEVVQWRDETPLEAAQREERERHQREGPFRPQYAGQHPAEATLDYLASLCRTSMSADGGEIQEHIQQYFDWKAKR